MADEERFFLYDETEDTKTRYVSFMGVNNRFDLAIMKTERYFGKQLVLNIQNGRFGVIGSDDLNEPGNLEHAFNINEEDAEELRAFLFEMI